MLHKLNPKRTLKEAIDLDTMSRITSDALLSGGTDYYHQIRHQATGRHLEENHRYTCAQCGHWVFVSMRNKQPLWQHYKGAPQDCPWWTGAPDTIDQVSASQFQGQQESPLHWKLKHLIAELLRADPTCRDTKVEEIIRGENGRRKPDVQTLYGDRKTAFEIQLATTQIPIILEREMFYQREKMSLIWLTWQFEEVLFNDIQQSFKDVYYRHQKNIFSLDDETIELSRAKNALMIRAHTFNEKKQAWEQKVVGLADLAWPPTGLPYFFVNSWEASFRKKWLKKVTPDGMQWADQDALLREAALQTTWGDINFDQVDVGDLSRLVNAILSLEKGEPIGTREMNLFGYSNSFLSATSRHRYANIFEWWVRALGCAGVIEKETVQQKLNVAKQAPQLEKSSLDAEIIRVVFKDWMT